MAAIHEALASICEEGLENVWYRHKLCAEALRKGLVKIELKNVHQKEANRLHDGIGIFNLPHDVSSDVMLEYLKMRYVHETNQSVAHLLL